MTIINTNSISGINSITAQGASGIEFYDSSGNSVHTVTGDGLTVGTGATISGSTNTIDFRTGNSSVVRIDSSTRLSVGGAGSIDSQFQVVNSSQDTAESVARFESAAAGSGFSQSLVHVYKGNGYGGAIGGYIDQGVGHGLSLNTVNDGTLSERLRITSAGNVGINDTNPSDALTVYKNNVGNPSGITIRNTNAGSTYSHARLRLESQNGAAYGEIWADVANAGLRLGYNSSSTVKIDSTGNIVLLSGRGINFHNYGTGANIDSNLLDDYEEGNFDPNFTSASGTLTSNNTALNYVKVGRQVTCAGRIYVNGASTPSGTVSITLPFAWTQTPNTGIGGPYITHGLAYLHGPSFPANYQRAFWELSSGTNLAALYYERDNQAWTTFDGSNFSIGDYITVNITYFTDL